MTYQFLELQSLIISCFCTVSPDVSIEDAITKWHCTIASSSQFNLSQPNTHDYLFVTDQEKLVGIITYKALCKLCINHDGEGEILVREVMEIPKLICERERIRNVEEIINIFKESDISCLPIVNQEGDLEGFISCEDVAKVCYQSRQKQEGLLKESNNDLDNYSSIMSSEKEKQWEIDSLYKRLEREKLVYQITSQIHNTIKLEDTLNVTVNLVRDFMKCDRILIYKFEGHWGGQIIAESVDEKFSSALGNYVEDSCFQDQVCNLYQGKDPIITNNIYEQGYTPCHIQLLEQYQVKANLIVPLEVSGELWGLLIGHQCETYREWQLEDVELLKEISYQVAIAIYQSEINQKLQKEIYERIVAEKLLQRQKRQYRNLMEILPVGIFRNDLRGNCTYVNEQYCRITGLTPELADGIGWQKIIHPEDWEKVFQAWENLVNYHQPCEQECRFLHPNGDIVWGYVQCILDRDISGKIIGFVGSITDITDRKINERQLKENEARFEKIATTLPGILYLSRQQQDGSIEFDYISEEVTSIFELSVEEVMQDGSLIFQQFHPEDIEEHYQRVKYCLENDSLFFHEWRIITPSSKIKWLQGHCRAEKLADGQIYWVGLAIDITEKKETQAKLAKTESLFRQAEKIAKIGSWEYDAITGNIYWSDEIYNIFEVDPKQSPPNYTNLFDFIHPDDRAYVAQAFQQHLREDTYYNIVHRLLMTDGRVKYVREHCETYRDQQGNAIKSIGTVQDITEQQIAENVIKNIIQGTSTAVSGKEFFENLVTNIALSVEQPCVVITKLKGEMLESLAYCYQGKLQADDTIPLQNTPCECAMKEGYYYCTEKVAQKFPTDPFLEAIKAESYVGIPLINKGEILGTICVLNDKPTPHETIEKIKRILDVFAPRAVAEFIRMRAEEELQTINLTLESQVNERTKQLSESQQFIKTILDTIPLPVLWKDKQSKYLGCNREFLEFVNLSTKEEIIGKSDGDFALPPEEIQRYQEKDSIVMTTAKPMLGFEETVTVDGKQRWIESNKVPLRNSQGEIIGVLTIFKDITQEKAIQTALRTSEARWQFALDGASHGVWDVNLITNETYYSPKFMEILGYELGEWGNSVEDWQNRIHPDDKEVTLNTAQKYLNGEIPTYQTEHRLRCKDGSYRWILARGKFVEWDENGNPTRMIGTNTDISDRILMEQELLKSKNNFQRLVEEIGNNFVIFSHTLEDVITYVSGGIESIFGLTKEEIIGKSWVEAVNWHETSLERALTSTSLILNAEDILLDEFDMSFTHKSGEEKIIRVCHHVVKNDQQDAIAIEGILEDITESKKALSALKRKTQELDRFFSLALDLLCIGDFQGNFIRLNPQWENILGYRLEDLENSKFLDYVHPDDLENTLEAMAYLSIHPELPSFVNRYRCADGSYRWIEWRSASDGNLIYNAAKDITERLKAEEEKQALINALENTNNLLTGISNAQSQFITAENRITIFEGLLSSLLELTDSEYGFIGEVLFRDDGSAEMKETFLKIKGVPYIKTHSITNIAWNEETQKFYEENYELGMEFSNMNTLFGAVIMTGKPVIANSPKTDPRSGGTPDGHPPLNAFLGLPFFNKNKLLGVVGIANRPGGYDQSIVDYLQPFLVTCSNLIEGYRLDRDRRKTEEKLALSNQELIRATRLKDEFLANMSHELRTPLNAILGNTEILTEQVFGELNNRQIKSLKTIESSSNHLLSLINDILDVAKIEAGQITLECVSTDVKNLSQSALVFVQQQAQKKGIQLESRFADNLPYLPLDQRRIRQALINLLNNAVKFTPQGGKITLEISICKEESSQESLITGGENNIMKTFIRFAVIDTGIGIAPENIEKLFKPFIQIDSALNRKYSGTGLGLSLVKQIAELHGGSVRVESQLGKGSCFYLDLPYIFASCNLSQSPASPSQNVSNSVQLNTTSRVILVAEDNENNISTMTDYLKAKGYQLLIARNGLEALSLTKNHHPDVIIMDIQMPEMDGLDAIALIRQDEDIKDIPIIAATALTMEGDEQRCLNAGANSYMSKPLRLRELVDKIEALL